MAQATPRRTPAETFGNVRSDQVALYRAFWKATGAAETLVRPSSHTNLGGVEATNRATYELSLPSATLVATIAFFHNLFDPLVLQRFLAEKSESLTPEELFFKATLLSHSAPNSDADALDNYYALAKNPGYRYVIPHQSIALLVEVSHPHILCDAFSARQLYPVYPSDRATLTSGAVRVGANLSLVSPDKIPELVTVATELASRLATIRFTSGVPESYNQAQEACDVYAKVLADARQSRSLTVETEKTFVTPLVARFEAYTKSVLDWVKSTPGLLAAMRIVEYKE